MVIGVDKQVLGFDVSVADAESMQVGQGPEVLVDVQLDEQHGHGLLHLAVMLQNAVHGLRHVIHDDVQVYFVLLLALGVECMPQRDHIRVEELTHDLKLTVFVPLVLVDLLDSDDFTSLSNRCLRSETRG